MKRRLALFAAALIIFSGCSFASSLTQKGLGLDLVLGMISAPDATTQQLLAESPQFTLRTLPDGTVGRISYEFLVKKWPEVAPHGSPPYSELVFFFEVNGVKYVVERYDMGTLRNAPFNKTGIWFSADGRCDNPTMALWFNNIFANYKDIKIGMLVTSPGEFAPPIPNISYWTGTGFAGFSASQASNYNVNIIGEPTFRVQAKVTVAGGNTTQDKIVW